MRFGEGRMAFKATMLPKSGSTGVLKWSYQANGALSSPAIGNDATVYVNDEHHVNAVR